MEIYYNNIKLKQPIGIEKIVNRLMIDIAEEQIFDLSVEICNLLEKATEESISQWSGAFQTITDIAEGYLLDTLDKEKYFNLIGQVTADISFYEIEEIISRAAEHLGYVS